jgi:hypothetical protein
LETLRTRNFRCLTDWGFICSCKWSSRTPFKPSLQHSFGLFAFGTAWGWLHGFQSINTWTPLAVWSIFKLDSAQTAQHLLWVLRLLFWSGTRLAGFTPSKAVWALKSRILYEKRYQFTFDPGSVFSKNTTFIWHMGIKFRGRLVTFGDWPLSKAMRPQVKLRSPLLTG